MTITPNRTDPVIQEDVIEELSWTPQVNSAHIGVSVNEGAVTLNGQVGSYAERIAAKNAALRVDGVSTVADDIQVETTGPRRSDTQIAESVTSALSWSITVPDTVKAEVRDHVVILTGKADWDYQRRAATHAIEHLGGVVFVDNRIELTHRPTTIDTTDRIHKALLRSAAIDADAVTVSVNGAEVTLTGQVSSWVEKKQAEHAAYSSPSVSSVRNNLTIRPS